MKFKIGDRVRREINIYDPSKGMRYGKVVQCYSKPERKLSPGSTLGPYPELYEVLWDDGTVERGFLPHGLDAC